MPPTQVPQTVPFTTTCLGGINQNKDNADPTLQCQDALNVWAPNGIVTRRPGCIGLENFQGATAVTAPVAKPVLENPPGTFSNSYANFNSLPVGSRIYFSQLPPSSSTGTVGISLLMSAANTALTYYIAEYWNGAGWRFLPTNYLDNFMVAQPVGLVHQKRAILSQLTGSLNFVMPADVTDATSFNASAAALGVTGTTIRITLLENAFSAAVTPNLAAKFGGSVNLTPVLIGGISTALMPTGKWGIVFSPQSSLNVSNLSAVRGQFGSCDVYTNAISTNSPSRGSLSVAAVLSTGEFFASWLGSTFIVPTPPVPGIGLPNFPTITYAQVETGAFAVGPGAPYDPTVIALNTSWPTAKFITFMNNQLWAVTDSQLSWTGPVPYHKVWPSLAFEYIQGDNSPTTALKGFNSRVYVGKLESLYATQYTTTDNFGIDHYVLQRVVSGIGPVSNNALTEVENTLVFLAEPGLFQVDTAGNLRNVSDWSKPVPGIPAGGMPPIPRLNNFWSTINPSARSGAAAINWKTMRVYLLSVPTGTSTINDTTVVWDYAHDSLWLWKGFNAQYWMKDINEYGNETLYFGDANGNIYQFGVGDTDHGAAIDSYLVTEPIGYKQGLDFQIRRVEVDGRSASGQVTASLFKNDNLSVAAKTGTIDFSQWQDGGWKGGANVTQWATANAISFPTVNWNGRFWCANTSRRRFKTYDLGCKNVAVKLESKQKGVDFRIGAITLQMLPIEPSFTRRMNK